MDYKMVVKKNIVVEDVHENGVKVLSYRGEDRRYYNQEYQKTLLGVSFSDWLKIGLTLFGIITFMIKDNIRISALEEGQKKLTELSVSMKTYMEQSDGFHSSIFATQFQGGRPIDKGFSNRKNNFNEK